jgi:hypothetical protein
MSKGRDAFNTELNSEMVSAVRALAKQEGRDIQELVHEAKADLIEKRKSSRPREHVLVVYSGSRGKYGELYRKLAE